MGVRQILHTGGRYWRLGVIGLVLGTGLLNAVPVARVSDSADYRLGPLYDLTAGRQGWAMFAPTPSNRAPSVEADIHFANGDIHRWKPTNPDDWQMLRDRRWEKLSKVMQTTDSAPLWEAFANNLSREFSAGDEVADVVLLRVTSPARAPGALPVDRVEEPFFSLGEGFLFSEADEEPIDNGDPVLD